MLLLGFVFQMESHGQSVSTSQLNQVTYDSQGRPIANKKDSSSLSLKHRDGSEDSITTSFRYFDSSRYHHMDSSINDFNKIKSLPFTYVDLGNSGTPAHSLLFDPSMHIGWDAGFHSMDIYRYTLENTRYFVTTKPFTSLGYIFGGNSEQWIDALHTQNRKSNVNFAIEFRLNNDPGVYKSQNTNNSNIRFNVSSQSKNKRYSFNLIYIANNMNASANGGLANTNDLNSNSLGSLFSLTTRLASSSSSNPNPFNTTITTGNKFSDKTIYYRHSFDFGQKDSIVNDSSVTRLFYPRLRLEHSLKYSTYNYQYIDGAPVASDYLTYYNYLATSDTIHFQDKWTELNNEFAIITYPDKKNQGQFFKLDGGFQSLKGTLGDNFHRVFNNTYVGAEYRNHTKNQKWDLEAVGKLYVTGTYVGNYSGYVSLKRTVANIGALQIGAQNVNRTPSFLFNSTSSDGNLSFNTADTAGYSASYKAHSNFPVINAVSDIKKENILKVFANLDVPRLGLRLTGNYFAYTNYAYFDGFFNANQSSSIFNYLQIGAQKATKLGKFFKWYADIYVQKKAGNANINLPLILMRHRIAFEANFFTNLFLATGFEIRYYSPYKADNYSPFIGQYFYQDSVKISNRPDISYYLNFRIKRFRFFAQIDNLNTMNYSKTNGFGFNKYNFSAPNYPGAGMWYRMGFKWMFIN